MKPVSLYLSKYRRQMMLAALAVIVLIGLCYRVLFALRIEYSGLYQGTPYTHDEYHYLQMAERLLDGRGYGYLEEIDAYVTPGYPLFLTGVFALFGTGRQGVMAVRLIQAALSAAGIGLVYVLARQLTGHRGVALLGAILVSLYPPLILSARSLLTESLYIFFLLLYLVIQMHALRQSGRLPHVAAGAVLGLAVLIRPLIVALLPLPYVYAWIADKDPRRRRELAIGAGLFAAAWAGVMAPWWIRNLVTLHRFIPLSTQGNAFYAGIVYDFASLPAPANAWRDGFRLLLDNLITQPWTTLKWFTLGKLEILFFGHRDYWLPGDTWYLATLVNPMHTYIVACGTLGTLAGLTGRASRAMRLMAVYTLAYILLTLLGIPTPRYALQYIPLFSIFAAQSIFAVFTTEKRGV